MKYLLDTHILVWWLEGAGKLNKKQRAILEATDREAPFLVSDVSLLEIATLVNLGRLELDRGLREWLDEATAPPLVQRVGITPAVAAQVADLPKRFHRDPADRVVVATAMVYEATILTADERIRSAKLCKTI